MLKTCSKCKTEKPFEQFSKKKGAKDGLMSKCKVCMKEYYEENKEKIIEQNKKYYQENMEAIKERKKKHYEENKENITERDKKYRNEHKEKINKRAKKYRENNKEKIKKYRKENKEKLNEHKRNRYNTDEGFRILCRLRTRLAHALKGKTKYSSTMELVGCSMEFLIDYLEKTKVEGKDYMDGEVDHIRPCASFDLTDPEQQRECFHYTNLQWLTKEDNREKSAKLVSIK